MTPKTAFICLLTATTALVVSGAAVQTQQLVTVFFTGNELGAMQPCGCSGGQLGGLDRRYSVFNTVTAKNRLIFDTGLLVPESTEQNLIKFNIIVQAYSMLGYDVINLTKEDISIARQVGLLDSLSSVFGCITAASAEDTKLPEKYTKKFTVNGTAFEVTIASAENEDQLSRLAEIFSSPAGTPSSVNILILNQADAKTIASVSKIGLADVLITPSQSDEPTLISEPNAVPLVISAGRIGKYVGKIEINPDGAQLNNRLKFAPIPVTEDIPQHQPLVELYREYQRLVKDANIIEKQPRFILPNSLEYVGSKYCKLCHDYEYEKWQTSRQVVIPGLKKQASPDSYHAAAFATLTKVGSDFDPECVVCHVIGMQYQTGYISPAKTPELKDVGCENCHGPGSEHLRSLGAIETSGPISTCSDCHTVEHSNEYAANEKQYFDKIIHWREPVSRVKVKEPNNTPMRNISK
jgi:hypothetical protein